MAVIQPLYRLEVTAPDDAALSGVFVPQQVQVSSTLNEGSTLVALGLTHHLGWLADEAGTTNPVQLNSRVVLKRARYTGAEPDWPNIDPVFTGRIRYRALSFNADGHPQLEIHAESPLAFLKRTLASVNGRSVGTMETPSVALEQVSLFRVQNSALPEFAYFPDRTSDAWLPTTFRPVTTTLDANINDTDTTIVATTTHGSFTPAGVISIDSEWIYYDGYQNDGSGGKHRFLNCTRGILGTTAASHTASPTTTIYQQRPARMSPRRAFYLEKQITSSSAWIPLGDAFTPADQSGYFTFDYDILGFAGDEGPFNATPRATYAVYDEDHANRVSVGSVLRLLLEEAQTFGGAGWVEGTDFDIDPQLDDLTLVRFQVDSPMRTLDAVQDLFAVIGLQLGDLDNAIVASEDAGEGKVTFALARQKDSTASADVLVGGIISRHDAVSMEDIHSGVVVAYQPVRRQNLLAPARSWHPALNDTIGANARQVKKIIWRDMPNSQEKADKGLGWQQENSTSSHQQRVERVFFDNPNQSWGLQVENNTSPGADADVLVCWFDDVTAGLPALQPVGRISAMLDLGWTNNDTDPVHVQLIGLAGTGVDVTTDPPTYGSSDEVWLGAPMEIRFRNKPDDYGNMRRFQEVELELPDAGINLRGLVVRYQGMPTRSFDGNRRTAAITTLRVEGPTNDTVLIQTTASTGQGSQYIYAPASHAKLRDVQSGEPDVAVIDIGQNTRETAIAIGRLWLINALLLVNTYDITVNLATDLPRLGLDTVEVADAGGWVSGTGQFTTGTLRGLAQSATLTLVDGEEQLRLVLRDYQGGLLQ